MADKIGVERAGAIWLSESKQAIYELLRVTRLSDFDNPLEEGKVDDL